MYLSPCKIKDIERLQKYERIINTMLQKEKFTKGDIYKCGESSRLIGRALNILYSEGTIIKSSKSNYIWVDTERERYKKAWQSSPISSHQLKRLSKEER